MPKRAADAIESNSEVKPWPTDEAGLICSELRLNHCFESRTLRKRGPRLVAAAHFIENVREERILTRLIRLPRYRTPLSGATMKAA